MRLPLLCVIVAALAAVPPYATAAVRDGDVRFEVITPSLVRLQYAPEGRFEDRPTLTTGRRPRERGRYTSRVRGGDRVIRTPRITLRWRRGSEPVGPGDLEVRIGRRVVRPAPGPNPEPLGGWRRSLDLVDGPVPLHEGVLSRAGWYLLDDSATPLLADGALTQRRRADGYQDLYLFAYGSDYARALADLRALTGPAPLLPRRAFGVWFSRWWPYGEDDWKALAERFRQERVPLDTISLDTDFKRVHDATGAAIAAAVVGAPGEPYSWNGWDWNRELFPDPPRFFRWADDAGIDVGLNVHPSISTTDPRFEETRARTGGALRADDGCRVVQADPFGTCMVFDWSDPRQLDAYMQLHEPFERDGADFWWLDWCCDGSHADAPGLTPDTWINRAYFDRQRARGSRWPAFSRIGGSFQAGFGGRVGTGAFAEHRYSLQFTGDTCATWPLLAFASEVTTAAASIGMPYVSHDIGTFHGVSPVGVCDQQASPVLTAHLNSIPEDMYVRWVQLGTFQPLDRLHSHHGARLPWEYPGAPGAIAAEFLRLRGRLVPYLYALARESYDTGLPIARAMWLSWPDEAAAYEHRSQYTLGRDVLVAPVSEPGDPARVTLWFPPGTWVDWFTGERHSGPAVKSLSVPLARMALFVRAGGIVPMQEERTVALLAHAGSGSTVLYDDAGTGFGYQRGEFTRTPIRQRRVRGTTTVKIGRARGGFAGAPRARSYELRLVGVPRPRSVTVRGRRTRRWSHDAAARTLVLPLPRVSTGLGATVVVR